MKTLTITNELKLQGISFTGMYSNIPTLVLESINEIKHFGKDYFLNNNVNIGNKLVDLILKLELTDGRKSVYNNVTCKNELI